MKELFASMFFFFSSLSSGTTLHQKQVRFAHLTAELILQAEDRGFEITLGEAWRSIETAKYDTKYYADQRIGVADSLHTKRLAIDLNLFQDGKYLTKISDYEELGIWWEKQGTKTFPTSWGGRFKRLKDANHFSMPDEGVR